MDFAAWDGSSCGNVILRPRRSANEYVAKYARVGVSPKKLNDLEIGLRVLQARSDSSNQKMVLK